MKAEDRNLPFGIAALIKSENREMDNQNKTK